MWGIWKRISQQSISFWHWSSTWGWFAVLFVGGLALLAVNEFAIGLFLLGLSALSLCSKLWNQNWPRLARILGTAGIVIGLAYFTVSTIAYMEERPWSNLTVFWKRFVVLKHISTVKFPKYPPNFSDFPSTNIPVPLHSPGTNITVQIGPSPESNYAYETRFILTNHNSARISNISYICETQKIDLNSKLPGLRVKLAPAPSVTVGPIVGDLPAGDSHSIYCDFAANPWANDLERPELAIWISYQYHGEKQRRGFKFLAIPTQDGKGNFIWLPRGAAEEIKP